MVGRSDHHCVSADEIVPERNGARGQRVNRGAREQISEQIRAQAPFHIDSRSLALVLQRTHHRRVFEGTSIKLGHLRETAR